MRVRSLLIVSLVVGVCFVLAGIAPPASAAVFLDNFERPDSGDMGPFWAEQWPDWSIVGGAAQSIASDKCSLMTVNGYDHPEPSIQATVAYQGAPRAHYVALVVLYLDNEHCVFVKIQDGYEGSPPDGLYDTAYYFMGNNSQVPWGSMEHEWDDWDDLFPYFSTANIALTVIGDVVYLAVDRDLDGDFMGPNDSLYGRGELPLAELGQGVGVGGYDGAMVDDFLVIPEPATLGLLGLGLASLGWRKRR